VKILFDECMPQPLRRRLAEFEISTAQEMGWGRVKNGELLKRAEGVFDILLTADQELKYQQNLKGRQLAILVLSTNRWPKVQGKTPEIIAAIQSLRPGDYLELAL
jgi:predicted nuclease of predicted toxin-antitoxin system